MKPAWRAYSKFCSASSNQNLFLTFVYLHVDHFETSGHAKCLEIVLDLGNIDVDILNEDDNSMTTGLMVACKRATECVELLLDRNAALEKADKYGKTPLIYSCMKDNNDDVVRALLKRGALPNSKDNSGSTPLMYCAQYTDSDKMQFA